MKKAIALNIDMVQTGEKLRQLRIANGISVEDVSDLLNVSLNAVYKWQRGQALPTIENMLCLSKLFHLPVEELLVYEQL